MKRINLNNREPIDPDHPGDYTQLLRNLQSNILNDNGRHYEQLILVRFPNNPRMSRDWVKRFAGQITSAARQRRVAKLRRQQRDILRKEMEQADAPFPHDMWKPRWKERWKKLYREERLITFFLSAQGYHSLGIPKNRIPHDFAFLRGMKSAQDRLHDDHSQWEAAYMRDPGLDAVILLAHDDAEVLRKETREVQAELAMIGADVTREAMGAVLYSTPRVEGAMPREHFGYQDGLSNPLFLSTDFCHEIDDAPVQSAPMVCDTDAENMNKWDPFAPLSLVVVEEPDGPPNCCGSYLVLRKLEQNVKLFNTEIKRLAAQLKGDDAKSRESRAEAMAMGRHRDGTPIVFSPSPDEKQNRIHFNYQDGIYAGEAAGRCPFHAHILKANPRRDATRDSDAKPDSDRWRRIVRRGITYGERAQNPDGSTRFDDIPTEPVGLFFMSYQRDITQQFEFIQKSWLDYTAPGVGLDPIAGQRNEKYHPQRWPEVYGGVPNLELDLRKTVSLRGGEYLFAPSIPFLKSL